MNARQTSETGRSFFFVNKSCNRRQEEIGRVADFLAVNGWRRTSSLKWADLTILFTCAFCQGKVREMIEELEKARSRMKPSAELMVGSCLPKTDPKSLQEVFDGKTITPTDFAALNSLPGVTTRIEEMPPLFGAGVLPQTGPSPDCTPNHGGSPAQAPAKLGDRIRAQGFRTVTREAAHKMRNRLLRRRKTLYLAAGCLRKCSYCAIRFATGRLRSKPLPWVLRQIEQGLQAGYRKFELYADSIGDFGLDLDTNLGELFTALASIRQDFSVGIYDLHPAAFTKHFDAVMTLCRQGRVHYLYVPVQSGNPRILQLMRRAVDPKQLRDNLLQVKATGCAFLQTSVIVGFPSETEEEFMDTLNLLKDVGFNHCYLHPYTDMPGTESSQMPGKVGKDAIRDRLRRVAQAGIKHNVGGTTKEWEKISE